MPECAYACCAISKRTSPHPATCSKEKRIARTKRIFVLGSMLPGFFQNRTAIKIDRGAVISVTKKNRRGSTERDRAMPSYRVRRVTSTSRLSSDLHLSMHPGQRILPPRRISHREQRKRPHSSQTV